MNLILWYIMYKFKDGSGRYARCKTKNDVVFKALFSRGKPRITQAMLEAILKMKIDN